MINKLQMALVYQRKLNLELAFYNRRLNSESLHLAQELTQMYS